MGKSWLSGTSILLAEDDEDFRVVIRYALELAGFAGNIDLVSNYRGLFGYLEEREKPSLIILDLQTSPEDWRAALQELKSRNRYKDIPVVVLAASDQPEDVELFEKYRRCSYIQKPATFEDWRARMEKVIRNNLVETSSP
ncbi:MAG: two-component system response regulator [Deltaproteobacteria bacterium HGW-Deltaproteobacteria-15]|jgi:DNA-binding response OmpR family regulator|nr:MAG: two-component system response regulator [Deltaproteobacteria bacterium HGW-Deltaproteobacteria-15]